MWEVLVLRKSVESETRCQRTLIDGFLIRLWFGGLIDSPVPYRIFSERSRRFVLWASSSYRCQNKWTHRRPNAPGIGPTAGRADASGNSPHSPNIHPLAFSGYRTIPGGGPEIGRAH